MQTSDSSLYDFGFLSVLRDLSPLSVHFESLVMNVSRDLTNSTIIDAYIVVSFEVVVKSVSDWPGASWVKVSPRYLPPLTGLDSSNPTLVALP